MVAILLLVLKIIGILLLVLLGVALVLILLLLFYPLRYRLTGDIPDMEHRRICLRARWMLCVARFTLLLDETNEPRMCLRILGIPIWRSPGKEHGSHRKEKVQKDADDTHSFVGDTELDEEMESEPEYDIQTQEIHNLADDEETLEHKPPNFVKVFLNKIRTTWQRICTLPERIRTFLHNLHKKCKDLGTIMKDEGNQQAGKLILSELLALLKRYGPKRVSADVDFGTADPAQTGQILAVLSVMPFLYGGNISIQPDFESEQLYVKGTFDIRGRIQTCHIFGSLIRLYKDKNIKRLLRQLRK